MVDEIKLHIFSERHREKKLYELCASTRDFHIKNIKPLVLIIAPLMTLPSVVQNGARRFLAIG